MAVKVIQKACIVNYGIQFPLKKKEFVDLVECFSLLQEKDVLCFLDLESKIRGVLVPNFFGLKFRFFGSGKGFLYVSKSELNLVESEKVLCLFFKEFVKLCIRRK